MNKTARVITAISFMLALTACTCQQKTYPPFAGDPLIITLKPAGSDFQFGKITDAVMTVRNISDRAVAVLHVETGSGSGTIHLSGSVYGSVWSPRPGKGYILNTMSQQATAPCFHNGFLLPGQEAELTFRYRPVAETEHVTAAYLISNDPYDGAASSLPPLSVFLPAPFRDEMNITFVPYTEKRWLEIHRAAPAAGDHIGPGISGRSVIIDAGNATQREFRAAMPACPEPGAFTMEKAREAAARIMKIKPADVSPVYSSVMGGYIVLESSRSWVLKSAEQKGRTGLLPALPQSLAMDMDEKKYVTFRVGTKQEGFGPGRQPSGKKFRGRYPIYYGDGMYTQGEFIDVAREDLADFLMAVGKNGETVIRNDYFFGCGYYELIRPKP